MSIKKYLIAGCALTMMSSPVFHAFADTDIIVAEPPPAPRVETIPEARSGYVWSPGYWAWENSEHVWVKGKWIEVTRPHEETQWIPDHWEKRDTTHYHFVSGHWKDVD